jgi:hypothetical protein
MSVGWPFRVIVLGAPRYNTRYGVLLRQILPPLSQDMHQHTLRSRPGRDIQCFRAKDRLLAHWGWRKSNGVFLRLISSRYVGI